MYTNSLSKQEIDAIKEEQAEKSRRQDCKQHYSRISQGLEKFDLHSPARAIWELVQNARDLSPKCEFEITLTSKEFIFSHKGKPFTYDSLCSLVKQVSSQEKEDEANEAVGQYGTGFITTHSFGRIILVEGSFKVKENVFVDINDFCIDRQFDSIEEFIEKMSTQIKYVENLVDKPTTNICREWTRLKYLLSESSLQKAKAGIMEAKVVMPIVLTLNDRIIKCTINNQIDNTSISFEKLPNYIENDLNVMPISIIENGIERTENYYYITNANGKDKIVVPLETPTQAKNIDGIARLFLFFPLLGTEQFGMNYIFHSERFQPLEARNGIFLPNSNENTKSKYECNVQVLNEMSDVLFDYLENHIAGISNSIELAPISFNDETDDERLNSFYSDFKEKWVKHFKEYQMIDTNNGRFSVSQNEGVKSLANDITSCITEDNQCLFLSTIYNFASKCSTLPNKTEVLRWSTIIQNWGVTDDKYYVLLEDIVKNVKEKSDLLHSFLEFLKENGRTDFFTKYAIIPNKEDCLCKANELNNAESIVQKLYNTAKNIIPQKTKSFVHSQYVNIYDFPVYSRINLRDDINSAISELSGNTIDKGVCFDPEFEQYLIAYCSIFSTIGGASYRNRIMPIICKFNNVDYSESCVEKLNPDEPDLFSTAFHYLVKNQMLKIDLQANKFGDEQMPLLLDFLTECVNYESFKKNLVPNYCLFPNRNGNLCKVDDLFYNNGVDDDLISVYKQVLNEDLKNQLVLDDYENIWDFKKCEPKEVARKIEDKLKEDEFCSQITIDIIERLDDEDCKWHGLFEYIEKNKEELFFKRVQGDNKKNVYKLMKITDPDTLEALAEMSDNPNVKSILDLAKHYIEEEKYKQADFEFKHSLGVHIEALLREQLHSNLSQDVKVQIEDIEIDDVQNGQDIIVSYKEQPIYYIEIKTKWNFSEPAHMSKNQMKKAYQNPNCYALCCVDLTEQCEDRFYPELDNVIPNTYVHLNIGHELAQLMKGVVNADEFEDDDQIKMGGDYRCNISKKIFKQGEKFDRLIEDILAKFNNQQMSLIDGEISKFK